MSDEIKLVFRLSSKEDTTDVAKTIESLNTIPEVAFTPMSGVFGLKETIQGILSAPKDIPMKVIEKTADTISGYLKSREETKRLRSVELSKGDISIKLKGDAAREEVIEALARLL